MASITSDVTKTTIFIDKLSQPSRAVLWYCLYEKIPEFEVKLIQLRKSEHKTPEFLKINPLGKVPALNDKGFCIGESCTIVRYLSDKTGNSTLMPKDLQQRARIDCLLDDHHNNLRQGASRIFWFEYMFPSLGMPANQELLKHYHGILKAALKTIEATLTKNKFLAGELSFADMLVYSELRELDVIPYNFSPYPHISAWMKEMAKLPYHDEVFDVLEKLVASAAKKRAAKL